MKVGDLLLVSETRLRHNPDDYRQMARRPERKTLMRASGIALVAICCFTASCSIVTSESAREAEARARAEVQDQVRTLRNLVSASVSLASEVGRRAAQSTDDVQRKRDSVIFRLRFTDESMNALWTEPPMLGLLDIWALIVQTQTYLDTRGEVVLHVAQFTPEIAGLRTEVETELKRILGDKFEEAKTAIEKFAAERPIQPGFVRIAVTQSMLGGPGSSGILGWIPEFKLNPFESVGQGLGESAQAIETVGRSVDRFTDVAHILPLQISWQLELFQYGLEGNPQFNAISGGFADTAKAANQAVAAIEKAPEQIREQVVAALQDIDPKLAEVRATLEDVKAASDSLTPTAQAFDATAKSLEAMAAQLDVTLKTFNQTYILLDGDPNAPPPPPDAPKGHPFDVREFDTAGQTMTAMAAQLQQTLDTLNQLIRDPALTERIGEASGSAEATVKSVVWTLVGGALALAAGLAVVLFGYRRLTRLRP